MIEDLDFAEARDQGRERTGSRPSRGRRGRGFRRLVAGIPTGRFRDRLTQMTSNAGLAVIVVDPAYTSRWGSASTGSPRCESSHPEHHRPPCGGAGDRQTRTRPPGPAACDREPTRPRGRGCARKG